LPEQIPPSGDPGAGPSSEQPIGKISQIDALRALEPKYKEIQYQDTRGAFRHFSRMFLNSMVEYHRLFDGSLEALRKKAAKIHVRDFMLYACRRMNA
jgi:hypothetical protein